MIDGKKVLALIPARGGSKRLPRKNIMPLNGLPLISWTINAANLSTYVDSTVVSTDCEEILAISRESGANAPFIRPSGLAGDEVSTNDVILHALDSVNEKFDIIVLLQPTSPLRSFRELDKSIELLVEKNADGVVSVARVEHSLAWTNCLDKNGSLANFSEKPLVPVEDRENKFYQLNGAIYCYKVQGLMLNKGIFYNNRVYPYVMSKELSVDIDTVSDFMLAEYYLNASYTDS